MRAKRVRVGKVYTFAPVPMDRFFPAAQNIKAGDKVIPRNMPGCPPCGTMGHCHVIRADTGEFAGLVHCNSLEG